jgi:hypothetical protein
VKFKEMLSQPRRPHRRPAQGRRLKPTIPRTVVLPPVGNPEF